eukprot:TRINITY_DN3636_c0_g1_i3.p1 TRINITY_DN3636_c0_g1~~TRINITY_DN3636_c0_g1_i3.p1  ORF type:complete len:101 (+),score=7.77 TRINITY_DN3636_c0_g1_i3:279-581(+)
MSMDEHANDPPAAISRTFLQGSPESDEWGKPAPATPPPPRVQATIPMRQRTPLPALCCGPQGWGRCCLAPAASSGPPGSLIFRRISHPILPSFSAPAGSV